MEEPKVLYLCDEQKCEECHSKFPECKHTSDIYHAKNFEFLNGAFFEREPRDVDEK